MAEQWSIAKKQTTSNGGLVACQNWRAAEAGAAVLSRGGNAMDAAVTTALTLSVVEPWLSGVGGGGFLLHADGASGEVDTLDFNMNASRNLDPSRYPLAGGRDGDWFDWPAVEGDRNLHGYDSICVPGAVAGLSQALDRFGTISFAEALQPAIEHARRGLELDWYAAMAIGFDADILSNHRGSASLFLEEGRGPRPGEKSGKFLPMPAKAAMLERLASAGPRDFYEGEIAARLVADLAEGGSPIDATDLQDYEPVWRKPLEASLRGTVVHAMPGYSGGPTMVDVLGELEGALPAADPLSPQAALAFARAIRRASEHRLRTLGHASGDSCTTHLSVVDRNGNMVALTNTLLSRFGSKVVLPKTGILMNNGVMWFDPRPGQPNSIAPGVRPLANMCPAIASRNGRPWLALGAAGGRMIMPAVTQLLTYVTAYGMSLEEAQLAPRIDASAARLKVNRRAGEEVAAALEAEFTVDRVDDAVYPSNFAVPSMVQRQDGLNVGMAYPFSPWSGVRAENA